MRSGYTSTLENDFIDDNGDHHLAVYDRDGNASYADGRFNKPVKPVKIKPAAVSPAKKVAAASARDVIKPYGYKALKGGTPKQRAWAETIRSGIVRYIDEDVRGAFTDEPFHTSGFWIDNRDKSSTVFSEFARRDIELSKGVWAAHEAGDFESMRRIRIERDALQRKFGI